MSKTILSKKERLVRQARGQEVDCVPTLGGWVGGARNLAQLAGISADQYLTDPMQGVVKASLALDVDGMIQPAVHTELEQIRTGLVEQSRFEGIQPEAIVQRAEALPDGEK